jgi:hypothetical protein
LAEWLSVYDNITKKPWSDFISLGAQIFVPRRSNIKVNKRRNSYKKSINKIDIYHVNA